MIQVRIDRSDGIVDAIRAKDGGVWSIVVTADKLPSIVRAMQLETGSAFVDLFAVDARDSNNCFELHLVWSFDRKQSWLDLAVEVDAENPLYDALTPILPVAGWYEREIWDELGLVPQGHPFLRRLRRPYSRPEEPYLLRRETAWAHRIPVATTEDGDELSVLPEAPGGVVDYPLGPVRSGVVESAHYTLRTVGEELIDFRLQLAYKHRGIEKRAEGVDVDLLPFIAERMTGTGSFANSLALCQALEAAAAVEVPERACFLRSFFAELERLHNHFGFHADLCQATGLSVGQAQMEMLKERVLRLDAALTGHRYLFGLNAPGGLRHELSSAQLLSARQELRALRREFETLAPMLLGSSSHLDRLEGTGILTSQDATTFSVVGPVGRASGINRDVRRDHPYAAYDRVDVSVPLQQTGDASSRFHVRLDEINESFRLIDQLLDFMPDGPVLTEFPKLADAATGMGWAESPRGETIHWVRAGADGTLVRYRARPASFANWQAFPLAVPGHNILTDFPIIEQSFGLSVAGADR